MLILVLLLLSYMTCIYGQASGVPGPPPPHMVWSGTGGGGGRKRRGPLELPLDGGVVLGPGLTRKPFAGRKPYNVARAPVLINLNLYFKPYTQP